MKQMRLNEISYWTTVIDQRSSDKYNADIYFRKALGLITDWIKETTTLKIKPRNFIEKLINKEEDPFTEVFK